MSRPWSEAGLAEDWAALARNWAVALAIGLLGVWIAGFRCARYLERPDPVITADTAKASAYRDSLLLERGNSAVLAKQNAALEVIAQTAAVRFDSARHASASLNHRITIGAVVRPAAGDTGSSPAADAAHDTVAYVNVGRLADTTQYPVPKFFVDGYVAQQKTLVEASSAYEAERALRLNAEARFSDDSTHRAHEQRFSDSVFVAQNRAIAKLTSERAPFCQWKCGAIGTLGALALAAYALNAVHR